MREMKTAAVDQDNQVGEAEIALENHDGEIEIDQIVMTHHDHRYKITRNLPNPSQH